MTATSPLSAADALVVNNELVKAQVWGGWVSNPRPRDYESPALTTELPPRNANGARRRTPNGSESRARTCDPLINSQLLCQLSYLGMAPCRIARGRSGAPGTVGARDDAPTG